MKEIFKNEQYSPGTKIRKVRTVLEVLEVLQAHKINYLQDLEEIEISKLKNDLLKISGFGEAAVRYLPMLAGFQNIKPDEWIIKFVKLFTKEKKSPKYCERFVLNLHEMYSKKLSCLTVRQTDHQIWIHMRENY